MELGAALGSAIDACDGWVDAGPLEEARAVLVAPWRVVVVGRVSAGKSALVNAVLGRSEQATGLGGVTDRVVAVQGDEVCLIDTPGIDDPDRAVIELQEPMEGADQVLWVVDGLQPATASERSVLEHTMLPGTPLRVAITKMDLLEPGDRDTVLQRVRQIAGGWGARVVRGVDVRNARVVRGVDVRNADVDSVYALVAPEPPSPRQRAAVASALGAVRASLEDTERPADLEQLLDAWTEAVRAAVATVQGEIDEGRILHKTEALAALGARASQVGEAVQRVLGPDAPPRLPAPEPPSVTALGQVLASLSGQEGAHRIVKAGAARWMAEGQIALREWWAGQDGLQQRVGARRRLDERLAAVGAAL